MKLMKLCLYSAIWCVCALLTISITNNIKESKETKQPQIINNENTNNEDNMVSLTNDDINELVININTKLIEDVKVEVVDDCLIVNMLITQPIIDKVKSSVDDKVAMALGMFVNQELCVKLSKNQDNISIESIKIKDLTIPKMMYQDYESKFSETIIKKMKELSIDNFTIADDKINIYAKDKDKIKAFFD